MAFKNLLYYFSIILIRLVIDRGDTANAKQEMLLSPKHSNLQDAYFCQSVYTCAHPKEGVLGWCL